MQVLFGRFSGGGRLPKRSDCATLRLPEPFDGDDVILLINGVCAAATHKARDPQRVDMGLTSRASTIIPNLTNFSSVTPHRPAKRPIFNTIRRPVSPAQSRTILALV